MSELPRTAKGLAQPASPEDLQRDEIGFTNPNLHRRVLEGDDFHGESKLGVYDGLHSYRTVDPCVHDEESTTCEIP